MPVIPRTFSISAKKHFVTGPTLVSFVAQVRCVMLTLHVPIKMSLV